jgi:hypothetical protein
MVAYYTYVLDCNLAMLEHRLYSWDTKAYTYEMVYKDNGIK